MAKKDKYIPGAPPGSQGPKFEDFDFAYESEQIQKMAMQSDKANLADIDKQLAAADKEIARLAGRTSQLGRSGAQQIKAQNYENKVIETRRFLESEREAVVKILEEKKASLPQSYSSAAEEKNIARKAIQGPPQIKQAPVVAGPKYTVITNPMDPFTIGLEKAPAAEPNKPKPTAVGQIRREKPTLKEVTLDTGEVIKYESPGSLVLPEVTVGRTATGKAIKSTEPVKKYLDERMLMSDKELMEKYNKMGADYQYKLAQEQIDQAKYEFDYGKGEVKFTTGDEFDRVSSQEMFVRSSGRDNQEVVPASDANKAAESERIKRGGKEGTFERAQYRYKSPEERARENAKISREKSAANKRAIELQKAQDKNIRKAGNKNLTGTGVKTFEVSSKGSDLGKQFSALNATFKTGPYAGKTIEEVWQKDIKKSGKGRRPGPGSILEEGNIQQSKAEYQKLWEEWGKQNPEKMQELKSVVKRGYTLTDSFAGDPKKTVNQAEALSNITKSVNPIMGTPFKVKPPISKIKDTPKPKPGGSFEIPAAMKAAAASKVAQAIKKSKGLGMLNVPIMTKGSADKIFKDFLGKKDYSS